MGERWGGYTSRTLGSRAAVGKGNGLLSLKSYAFPHHPNMTPLKRTRTTPHSCLCLSSPQAFVPAVPVVRCHLGLLINAALRGNQPWCWQVTGPKEPGLPANNPIKSQQGKECTQLLLLRGVLFPSPKAWVAKGIIRSFPTGQGTRDLHVCSNVGTGSPHPTASLWRDASSGQWGGISGMWLQLAGLEERANSITCMFKKLKR